MAFFSNRSAFVKISLSMLGLALLLIIAGCDYKEPAKIKKIGIVLFGDSRIPQVNGFKDGLSILGYQAGESVEFLIRNAKNKRSKLQSLVKELIDSDLDLLVAAGGLEADIMKKMIGEKDVPVLVLYANAIIERGLIESRRDPGWNITGIDNLNAELSGKRVELMIDLLPSIKNILILYHPQIAPSQIGVNKAKEIIEKSHLTLVARAVSSRDEIKQVMDSLQVGEVDAMLTVPTAPIDNALKDLILPHVNRLKIPLMTHSRSLAESGALLSYGANFYDLGVQSSRLADKIFNGIDARKIPFEIPKIINYTINKDVMLDMDVQLNDLVRNQINEYISTNQ